MSGGKREEVKRLLVELDCLLDTRLGTIERLHPPSAAKLYLGEAYYQREIDDWAGLTEGVVSQAAFDESYKARDPKTLELSRPTRMLGFLSRLTRELDMAKITAPDVEKVEVTINVYPYQLTKREREILETLVYSYCSLGTEVTTTSLTYKEITPARMRDQYDGVILYEFDRWFSLHAKELNTVLIPRNTLFAPALYIKPPEELFKEAPEEFEGISPFAQLEMSMIERLGLELLRPREFSILPMRT